MKCCAVFDIIDGYEVVIEARERTFDPQETFLYVKAHFPDAADEDLHSLFEANKQYAPLLSNEKSLPDNTCHVFKEILAGLSENEKLLTDGSIIPNYRGKEFWIKKNNHWCVEKINSLGATIPGGGLLIDDLSKDEYQAEREEISNQQETDRIASLSTEEVNTEIQRALDALANESARLEKRAQIQRRDFDPIAWYEAEEAKVLAKYGRG